MENFAKANNIQLLSDWANISKQDIQKQGGGSLLRMYGSLRRALSVIYKEHEWKEEWFSLPKGFWNSKVNQRNFMDNIKKKLNIEEDKEWANFSKLDIEKAGGGSLLSIYKGSIFYALSAIYNGICIVCKLFIDCR